MHTQNVKVNVNSATGTSRIIAEVMTLEIVAPIYRGHPEIVQIFDEIYRRECADFIEEEAQMFATE